MAALTRRQRREAMAILEVQHFQMSKVADAIWQREQGLAILHKELDESLHLPEPIPRTKGSQVVTASEVQSQLLPLHILFKALQRR